MCTSIVAAVYSGHIFVWLPDSQTLAAVIGGWLDYAAHAGQWQHRNTGAEVVRAEAGAIGLSSLQLMSGRLPRRGPLNSNKGSSTVHGPIAGDQVLVIIGAAKCGTTSLFKYLSQHPAVCPSVPKEPAYFTEYRHRLAPVGRYEEVWPDFDPAVHRYVLEGSVVYTMWPEGIGVPARMRAYGLRPRLIYLVRDPIERIESQVNFRRIYSRQRISFRDSHPVDASRYATQLDPYVATFGRESVRVVEFAHLRTNPGQVCAGLFAWLGLEPCAISDLSAANETADLARSHLDRALADSDAMRRAGRLLPPTIRRLGRKWALRLAPYHHTEVRLSPERTREIRELLHQDVSRLAREWEVDVSEWGFDEATEADAD